MAKISDDPLFVDWLNHCHQTVIESDGTDSVASLPPGLNRTLLDLLVEATECLEQLENYRRATARTG